MPQKKSGAKAWRQTKKRTARNNKVRVNLDHLERQLKKNLALKDMAKVKEVVRQLTKSLDKAAQKNVIKKNAAARKKSRITKKINKI